MRRETISTLRSVLLSILAMYVAAHDIAVQAEVERVDDPWEKHEVYQGGGSLTAVGADFTGDSKTDIVASCGGAIRLFVAPNWDEVVISGQQRRNWSCIHSEVMDVDGDGDPDFIGAIAQQGVFWLERPEDPEHDVWTYHNIDNEIHGIHCTLKADIDLDGKLELLVNNFAEDGAAPYSLTWLKIPSKPREAESWDRYVLADGDAPGGNHYFGFGDVDLDGRPDVCVGAKGQPFEDGNWYAWWKNPKDPKTSWQKQFISKNEIGATNIWPADINADGVVDFLASRGHGNGVVWFEGPNWTSHEIDPSLAGPHCLQVLDIDGDGDIDAVTCAKEDMLAVWYENDGAGNFTAHVVGTGQAAYDIRALDMDGDKDIDFLIGGQASQNVVWYENPGHSAQKRLDGSKQQRP